MNLFKFKSSKNNTNGTAQAVTRNVTAGATVKPQEVRTQAVPDPITSKRPGRKPPPDLLVETPKIETISTRVPQTSSITLSTGTTPQAPAQVVPQRLQIAQKGMSIDAFNDYMDEIDRSKGLSKVGIIRINQHMASLKEPMLLDYGMSDVEFLRMMYQCMKLRDSVDIHSTKGEKGAAAAATFLSVAPTLTYKRVHANKVTRRMWAAEPLIAKYLEETVNPSLKKQGVPLVWSTRPSEGDGVQLCLSVIEDPIKPNRGVLPFKSNTEAHADIPGMSKLYPLVGGAVKVYTQNPSSETVKAYNFDMKHNLYMGYNSADLPNNELWEKIGMPREKLCSILDDIFECVSHHRAHPTEYSLLKVGKLSLKYATTKDQMKREIIESKITVIAQDQARPEIVRIVDHYNQDMVKNDIPVRFIALDFGEPGGGIKRGMGGHNLGIYVPKDVFSDEKDCLHVQIPLTKEVWLGK